MEGCSTGLAIALPICHSERLIKVGCKAVEGCKQADLARRALRILRPATPLAMTCIPQTNNGRYETNFVAILTFEIRARLHVAACFELFELD